MSLGSELMPGKMSQKSVKFITLKREQGIKGYLRATGPAVLYSILEQKKRKQQNITTMEKPLWK